MTAEHGYITDGEALLVKAISRPAMAQSLKMMEIVKVLKPYQEVCQQVASVGDAIYIHTSTNTADFVGA